MVRRVQKPVRVEAIEDVARLSEIELAWDELYARDPFAHFYLSSQFLSVIAQRVDGQFRILTAWSEDDRCVGFLPLIVTMRWSKTGQCLYNVLDMLGHVFDTDYTGILCDPGFEREVCQAFAQTLSAMPAGRIILNYFSGAPGRLDTFISAFDASQFDIKENQHVINDGQTNNLICPYTELPSTFSDYLGGLSANTRQKLRRLDRQLAADKSLKISRSRPETYAQDTDILAKLWYAKHVAQKGEKRAAHLADLFKEAILLGLASGAVYLIILWRDGVPIAAQANYIDHVKRQALFHVAGRDESVRDLSAGLILQAHAIRWAIANGLTRYDFTIGDEPYKYSLGAIDRRIASAEVLTRTRTNATGRLDDRFREDVLKVIRKFTRGGRGEDARIAAQQALATWPDLGSHADVEALIAKVSTKKR